MKFLYPENALFGVMALLLLLINKKILFTHLDFFEKKRFLSVEWIDVLIIGAFTILLMYPVTEKIKKTSSVTNYSVIPKQKKRHLILILDVSLSMKTDGYFDKEKELAKWDILTHRGDYIMIVVFEKEYKILQDFTADTQALLSKLRQIRPNMVTDIGGSMLRDTVAGIINSFRFLNPAIIIYSDGSSNDESSVNKEELKNLAKGLNISYKGFSNSKNNAYYSSIFKPTPIKRQKTINKTETSTKEIKYTSFDERFVWIALILLFYKILKVRFENRFDIV